MHRTRTGEEGGICARGALHVRERIYVRGVDGVISECTDSVIYSGVVMQAQDLSRRFVAEISRWLGCF